MLAAIHSYPGANADLMVMWPFFLRAQFDRIIVVGTKGGGCHVPSGAGYVEIGENRHIEPGHLDNLPRRLVDTAAHLLTIPGWHQACITEYDTAFFRPFPPLADGFHGHLAGGQLPGTDATFFFHFPFVADRASWQQFVEGGRTMLATGRYQLGSPDTFLCSVIEEYKIPYHLHGFKSFSKNTVHGPFGSGGRPQPDFIPEALQAYRDGAVSIHGIKTSVLYNTDAAAVLREIMRHD